jgi:hypothetical protein
VPILWLYVLMRLLKWLRARWNVTDRTRPIRRVAIVLAGALAISSPYLVFKTFELWLVLSRVPEPLHVAWIEYRLEESWGIGGPGDNETGFVIYRLTGSSAQWAREQGPQLGRALQAESWRRWQPTPVKDRAEDEQRWHTDGDYSVGRAHRASLNEYLQHYGFPVPLEKGIDREFNDAIRQPGSLYSYGLGGSVTVVDPKRGKVYFAYAG